MSNRGEMAQQVRDVLYETPAQREEGGLRKVATAVLAANLDGHLAVSAFAARIASTSKPPQVTIRGSSEVDLAVSKFSTARPAYTRSVRTGREERRHRPERTERTELIALRQQNAVRDALRTSKSDFRSVPSLARQCGLSNSDVETALSALGDEVRPPLRPARGEERIYRLVLRGPTWRERARDWTALISRDAS